MATAVKENQPSPRLFEYVSKWQMLIISVLLLSSFIALVYGVFMPLISVEKLWLFANTVSLISSIVTLFKSGNVFLGIIIALFSLILPLAKLILLIYIWFWGSLATSQRWLSWLSHLGKWSMLDVFIVAVMLVTVKLGAMAEVTLHSGLIGFALSVLMTKALTGYFFRLESQIQIIDKKSAKKC
ncbi:paraquat-inducible protein A [Piscirickettsia salmonis]|uniref:paraquat-inducible protein A n=1 Tax=Piscirickettsia salmonis TaxID=1238 RepID=UPI003A810EB3